MRLLFTALCLYMIFSRHARAEVVPTASATQVSTPIQNEISHERKLSLGLDLSFDSNLRNASDPDYSANSALTIMPSYKLNKKLNLSATVALEQKMYANQETQISNTTLALERAPIALARYTTFAPQIFAVLPTNEIDRNKNTLRGAIGTGAGVTQKYTLLTLPASANYSLSLLKNFHEFETTNLDSANLNYRIRHTLSISTNFTDQISLDLIGRYQTGWTYQNALRTHFSIKEQINYAANKYTSIYFNHSTDGDALKANGIDSNINIYDASQSSVAMGMQVTY